MTASLPLSVVVALISGRTRDVQRCLGALHAQTSVPSEIVVPYDDACADVVMLQAEFPDVVFVRADGLDTAGARAGASREHHNVLRSIGVRAARGDVVALTEDDVVADPAWCEGLLAALAAHPEAGAVGGAVECDGDEPLNSAAWFCDFGRYQNPLPDAPSAFLSDSNVAYRRAALERVAPTWRDAFHETAVHAALAEAGVELRTTPRPIVWQARSNLRTWSLIRERFVWGRSFAADRSHRIGSVPRSLFAVLSPMLPVVLTTRIVRTALARGTHRGRLLRVLPLIFVMECAWAAGELAGYVTGRAA